MVTKNPKVKKAVASKAKAKAKVKKAVVVVAKAKVKKTTVVIAKAKVKKPVAVAAKAKSKAKKTVAVVAKAKVKAKAVVAKAKSKSKAKVKAKAVAPPESGEIFDDTPAVDPNHIQLDEKHVAAYYAQARAAGYLKDVPEYTKKTNATKKIVTIDMIREYAESEAKLATDRKKLAGKKPAKSKVKVVSTGKNTVITITPVVAAKSKSKAKSKAKTVVAKTKAKSKAKAKPVEVEIIEDDEETDVIEDSLVIAKAAIKAKAKSKSKVKKANASDVPKVKTKITEPVMIAKSPAPTVKTTISDKSSCIKRSKLPLQDHQKRVIEHMKKNRGLIVNHAVGSGKTLTAVVASKCYLDENPKGTVIIVTPVSLQENMKKEMRAYGFDSDKDPRYKFFTIQKFATTYKTASCKDAMLIIDEAHEFRTTIPKKTAKNASKLSRAEVAVKCAGTAEKVLLLTATAIYNNPRDLANLVAMAKGIPAPGKKEYEDIIGDPAKFKAFFKCVMSFYDVPKDENYPTLSEHYEEIEMDKAYYNEYRLVEQQNSHLFSESNPFVFLTGVRQASNALTTCIKCAPVLSRAKEGKKMVIYSAFISFGVRKVQELFDLNNISYVEVTGSMNQAARNKAVQDYNGNKANIMFITKAGGQGLDLKGTRYVVIMESAWNRSTEQQVIGRAARYKSHIHLPKAEQHVDVYHLLVTKPKKGSKIRDVDDMNESADTIIKEMMQLKDEDTNSFLEALYPLSIEHSKCS